MNKIIVYMNRAVGRSLPDTDSVVLRTRCRLSTSENIISSGLYTENSAGEDEERLWGVYVGGATDD